MKIKKLISDIIVVCYIALLLICILVSNIGIRYDIYTVLELSTNLIYFGIAGILIYIINKILNKIKFDIYDLLIFILIVLGIVATVYAVDVDISLYGFDGRHEGLLQLIVYYILFLNCKNMYSSKCKTILISLIVGSGIIQAIYGILQFFDVEVLLGYEIIRNRFYSTGFEVNPNFFGTLMIIGLSLSMLIYFIKKNIFVTTLTLLTSSLLFLGLLCSGAMSVTVALIFLLLFIIILLFVLQLDIKWTLLKCLIISICFFGNYKLFNLYDEGYYLSQIEKTAYEMGETLSGDAEPIYGSGRIHIWRSTLKVVPDNIWNGVGIDNFYYAFGKGKILIDKKSSLVVDKAHNEYLQKLITEGIFSLIVYLILLILIFVKSIIKILKNRKKDDYLLLALCMCFMSYCIQAFFNISVISVAPIFYIIMGLLCSLIKGDRDEEVKN